MGREYPTRSTLPVCLAIEEFNSIESTSMCCQVFNVVNRVYNLARYAIQVKHKKTAQL